MPRKCAICLENALTLFFLSQIHKRTPFYMSIVHIFIWLYVLGYQHRAVCLENALLAGDGGRGECEGAGEKGVGGGAGEAW